MGTLESILWKNPRILFNKCPVCSLVSTFQKYSPCTQWVKWGQSDGFFWKIQGMYPVDIGWENCFRTYNELTMCPLGKCSLAPSDIRLFYLLSSLTLPPPSICLHCDSVDIIPHYGAGHLETTTFEPVGAIKNQGTYVQPGDILIWQKASFLCTEEFY